MSPKAKVSIQKKSKAEIAAEQLMAQTALETKKNQSNMATQLKNPKGSPEEIKNKQELWTLYSSLSQQSSEKAELLRRWLQDKSCKWINTYKMERNVTNAKLDTTLNGYGTKSLS